MTDQWYLATVTVAFESRADGSRAPAAAELAAALMDVEEVVTTRTSVEDGATIYRVDVKEAAPEAAVSAATRPAMSVCDRFGITPRILSVALEQEDVNVPLTERRVVLRVES